MFKWLFRKKKVQHPETVVNQMLDNPVAAISGELEGGQSEILPEVLVTDKCLPALTGEIGRVYFSWLFQSNFESQRPPSQRAEKLLKRLEQQLKNAKIEDLGLPRQPSILPRLMSVMRDKVASPEKLVELISSDAGFTVKVLSMANSPYFRVTEEPITDIKRALIYLGEDGLHRLVTTVLLQPILVLKSRASKALSEKFYHHVFLCANIGAWLATASNVPPQTVHLLGLLQGTGNISLLTFVEAYRQEMVTAEELTGDEDAWLLAQLFQRHSSRLAYIVARHWELGADIENALAYVTNPADLSRSNETSRLLLVTILSTYVKLLHDEDLIDVEQSAAWLLQLGTPEELLEKSFGGI